MDSKKIAIDCLQKEAQAILNLIPFLTEDFNNIVNMIFHCKGKVIITGVGKSGHIGAKIAATFASIGTASFFLNPLDAYHGDLGMVEQNDIVFALSNSGNTDELLRIIDSLVKRNIPIIGMSSNPKSLLAKHSIYHLTVSVEQEACPLNLVPTSSTTAALAMGDAIACALIERREFKAQDFARFHPGGSLGKRLLTQVKDVMLSDNLPVVEPNCKVCNAMLEISKRKTGLVIIVNEKNEIFGIVTDGDIRRVMQAHQDSSFFNIEVKDIIIKNPKKISEEAKLSEAEEVMRNFNIHSLLVVNSKNELTGIIDLFHCL